MHGALKSLYLLNGAGLPLVLGIRVIGAASTTGRYRFRVDRPDISGDRFFGRRRISARGTSTDAAAHLERDGTVLSSIRQAVEKL